MLLFGHPLIQVPQWYRVNSISSIGLTPPNSTIVISDIEKYANIAKHCKENSVDFACEVSSIKQAVIANALNADYILCCNSKHSCEVQRIANEYLWSAKVISIIENEDDIENIAKFGIDGAVIKSHIKSDLPK
jgi:gamma-glutamyl-gamma-aminobutyrate hydrolase PuuD